MAVLSVYWTPAVRRESAVATICCASRTGVQEWRQSDNNVTARISGWRGRGDMWGVRGMVNVVTFAGAKLQLFWGICKKNAKKVT